MNVGNKGRLFFAALNNAIGNPTLNSVIGSRVNIIERIKEFIV